MAEDFGKAVMLSDRGVFVVYLDAKQRYSVLTIVQGNVVLGDDIAGPMSDWGPTKVFNIASGRSVLVIVEESDCGLARATDLVRKIKMPDRVTYLQGHPIGA
jgi:hypothetical protein